MKDSMNYIEVSALSRELSCLFGARVDRIYQPKRSQILIQVFHTAMRQVMLKIELPNYITLSQYKHEIPEKPSHFAMFLRKYLSGSRLVSVVQPPFERIMEFTFQKGTEKYILICELFSKGNVIITDSSHKILVPMKAQTWKDRILRPKEGYDYPPKSIDFAEIEFENFKQALKKSERNQIVKAAATVLALGGIYAEELCSLSGVDKKTEPEHVTDGDYRILFKNFTELLEKAKESKIKPYIVFENKIPIDVQPFELSIYSGFEKEYFSTFSKALDKYYTDYAKTKQVSSKESEIDREIIRHETILKQHISYADEIKQKSAEFRKNADLIYQNLGAVQDIFNTILEAREKNIEWQKIIETIQKGKEKGNKEALLIREINPDNGTIILNLDSGMELNFTISVTDNANEWYTKAKKMDDKLPGVETAIFDETSKIENFKKRKTEVESVVEEEAPRIIEKREKQWFERFHWFYTSQGRLVIAGRDATQNEVLIKKHLEPEDIVFHTEAPGSPFAVLKKGKNASESEKTEAATFTLCHSKAWQLNRISEVYAVGPEQVSKKAPSGEYIARGGFMIYGKKEYIRDAELRLAVGLVTEPVSVISGTVDNVRAKAKYYTILIPGEKSKDEISKEIKEYWMNLSRLEHVEIIKSISLDEIKEHAVQGAKIFGLM